MSNDGGMTTISHQPAATTGADRAGYARLPGLMTLLTGDAKHDQAAASTLAFRNHCRSHEQPPLKMSE